jgi:putative PIN family toxin of toxin-antitoxin system
MSSGEARNRPKVVVDSNVLISGFAFPGGVPYQILQALLRGEIVAVISLFILTEVERNLRDKLRVRENTVRKAMDFLHEHCAVIDPPEKAAVAELTPADNRILDCAVQGRAQYLVTGDKGIQQLGRYQGINIVSPSDFLALIQTP